MILPRGEGGLIVVRFAPVFSKAQPQGNSRSFHGPFRADMAPCEQTWPLASRHGPFRADMAPFEQIWPLSSRYWDLSHLGLY